jgi:hypothetical protein
MWVDVLLLLVAVLPLLVENQSDRSHSGSNELAVPEEFPILSPIRIEAAPAGQPRQ